MKKKNLTKKSKTSLRFYLFQYLTKMKNYNNLREVDLIFDNFSKIFFLNKIY